MPRIMPPPWTNISTGGRRRRYRAEDVDDVARVAAIFHVAADLDAAIGLFLLERRIALAVFSGFDHPDHRANFLGRSGGSANAQPRWASGLGAERSPQSRNGHDNCGKFDCGEHDMGSLSENSADVEGC